MPLLRLPNAPSAGNSSKPSSDIEVGLIAITDVYESEAARDLAEVQRIVEENNVAVAKERLSILTGQDPRVLCTCWSEDFEASPPTPADRAEWVKMALDNNLRPCGGPVCRRIRSPIGQSQCVPARPNRYRVLSVLRYRDRGHTNRRSHTYLSRSNPNPTISGKCGRCGLICPYS